MDKLVKIEVAWDFIEHYEVIDPKNRDVDHDIIPCRRQQSDLLLNKV